MNGSLVLISATAGAVAVGALVAASAIRPPLRPPWQVPVVFAVAFAAISAWAVVAEGPVGFWAEHTRNRWGVQIWCDLLLALSIAWLALLPRLRAAGMRPWPWLVLVLALGSIGVLLTLARLLAREGSGNAPSRAG